MRKAIKIMSRLLSDVYAFYKWIVGFVLLFAGLCISATSPGLEPFRVVLGLLLAAVAIGILIDWFSEN